MLEIRCCCEHCNIDLSAASKAARICTFECTFCADCVENVLQEVCPNCGAGFQPRPIRPAVNFINDNFLGKYPAATERFHRPVDLVKHAKLVTKVRAYWQSLSN